MKHSYILLILLIFLMAGITTIALYRPKPKLADIFCALKSAKTFTVPFSMEKDRDFLTLLRQKVADKSVVVLGETLHSDGTSFLVKGELVKYFHDSLGFNLLLFEAGAYDLSKLQESLIKRDSNVQPEKALWKFWSSSVQCEPLWNYIKSTYSDNKTPLLIGGIDCQFSGRVSDSDRLRDIGALLYQPVDSLQKRFPVFYTYMPKMSWTLANIDYSITKDSLQMLIFELEMIRNNLDYNSWAWEYIDGLRNVLLYSWQYPKTNDPKRIEWRDSLMFNNLLHHKRIHQEEKIIIWCSNMHASKGFWLGKDEDAKNLGYLISSQMGNKSYIILMDNYSRHNRGEEDRSYYFGKTSSIEFAIHTQRNSSCANHFLFFGNLKVFGEQMTSRLFESEFRCRPDKYADAIVYIDSIENVLYPVINNERD